MTPAAPSRPAHPVRAILVTGLATAVLLLLWWWGSDRPACRSTDFGSCAGSALLVAVVGVPAYLLVVWAGMRWAASAQPVLGVILVLVVTYAGVLLSEGIDPPLTVWPFVTAVLAGAYVALETRVRPDGSG